MKRFLMLLTIALTCLSLFAATAEAKRFGGGSSSGKQRTMAPQQTQKAPTAAPAPAAPASTGNKWLGPLAGLAIGAGLGAMFAGGMGGMGGLGGAMGGILMAVLAGVAVMFAISMFRKKQQQPVMQYAGAGGHYNEPEPMQYSGGSSPAVAAPVTGHIPADFPVDSFLRSAKTSFIRLQAANDRKDLNDIREYTTPEMFAEITMQLHERDNTPQTTSVVVINAQLLEVANEGDTATASVRFTGQLSENNGPAETVDEIWHVQKNLKDDKAVWLLSGIQQTTLH
ncbi:MAG: TIM44-like domain-containing protein [Gallionella sp.]|nr:TIM44-like domain-containing protein [Gallionella sp.]